MTLIEYGSHKQFLSVIINQLYRQRTLPLLSTRFVLRLVFRIFLIDPLTLQVSPESFQGYIRILRSSGSCTRLDTHMGPFWTRPGLEGGNRLELLDVFVL